MASSLALNDAPILAPAATSAGITPTECEPEAEISRSLVFRAGGRVYSCAVTQVREVVPLSRVTRLPGAPSFVLGLINVRGAIVTVLDAGALLHDRPTAPDTAMVLLVEYGPRGVGLVVERVADVRAVRTDEGYQRLDVRAAVARVISITEEQ